MALGTGSIMTRPTRMKGVVLGILALLALGLAAIAARSALTDKDQLRAHLRSNFAAWTGGELVIDGPTRVSIFPRTRIEVDNVSIGSLPHMGVLQHVAAKSMRAEFGVWSLLWGEPRVSRLTLYEPKFTARGGEPGQASPAAVSADKRRLIRVLREAPFSRLTIEEGELAVERAGGGLETVKDIQANMTVSQTGSLSLESSFVWRGETVAIRLASQPPKLIADSANIPMRITVSAAPINATISGEMTLANNVRLSGGLDLTMPHMRRFSRWMGVDIPDGAGLGRFAASGGFNWVGKRISFDDGTFALDGNRAIGALAVMFDKDRPEIDGTLALQTLNLDNYLRPPQAPDTDAATGGKSLDLGFPLLRHFDVDLRVSATEFKAMPVDAGQTALTLAVKSAGLSADISILDLFGGRGAGRLELDASQAPPHLRLTGTLTRISAQPCIEAFSLRSPIKGRVDVDLDVTGSGRTLEDWLGAVSGTLAVSMGAGILDLDLAKVMAEARKGEVRGWTAARGNATSFERLAAGFAFDNGSAHSENFAIRTGADRITGRGTIDIPSRHLDWRLVLPGSEAAPSNGPETTVAELTHSLHILGPWSDPTFRLEQKRAEDETPIGQRAAGGPRARAF